jgi:hypothetical protein
VGRQLCADELQRRRGDGVPRMSGILKLPTSTVPIKQVTDVKGQYYDTTAWADWYGDKT